MSENDIMLIQARLVALTLLLGRTMTNLMHSDEARDRSVATLYDDIDSLNGCPEPVQEVRPNAKIIVSTILAIPGTGCGISMTYSVTLKFAQVWRQLPRQCSHDPRVYLAHVVPSLWLMWRLHHLIYRLLESLPSVGFQFDPRRLCGLAARFLSHVRHSIRSRQDGGRSQPAQGGIGGCNHGVGQPRGRAGGTTHRRRCASRSDTDARLFYA